MKKNQEWLTYLESLPVVFPGVVESVDLSGLYEVPKFKVCGHTMEFAKGNNIRVGTTLTCSKCMNNAVLLRKKGKITDAQFKALEEGR